MALVCLPSGISIMCDCPYSGKTREIKADAKSEARKRNQLRKELQRTKEDHAVARKVLVDTRTQLAALQRILSLELGWVVGPYTCPQTTWKDRVREESYLKSELIHLINYLRECDPVYRNDPDAHPTKLSASTEDLLSVGQERVLQKLYHDRTVYRSENERRSSKCLWEYLELKKNYENKLYHNKVMEKEIAFVIDKIAKLQHKFLEDKFLIDYITEHHFTMKGCFLDAAPDKSDSEEDNREEHVLDSETEKFKNLWQQSRKEKNRMLNFAQALAKRVEFATQKIARAENVCSGNIIAIKNLDRKLKEEILLSKLQPGKKEKFGKFSAIEYKSRRSQLDAAVNENRFLRNFLGKTIFSNSKEDLERYEKSLLSTAEKYRSHLQNIRSSAEAAAAATAAKEVPPSKPDKKKIKINKNHLT